SLSLNQMVEGCALAEFIQSRKNSRDSNTFGTGFLLRCFPPDGEKVPGYVKIRSEHLFNDLLGKRVEISLETAPLCQKNARSLKDVPSIVIVVLPFRRVCPD